MLERTLAVLNQHHGAFFSVVPIATETGHPVPTDTRGWSQIIVSVLTGIKGIKRKKGPDLCDGSDVKGANTWEAIDTPRFNGVIKSGTLAQQSDSMEYLDNTPYLFFVLWDKKSGRPRCRVWVVRPPSDRGFREVCQRWYAARESGDIVSSNFQLHPPRGEDTDTFKNSYGRLSYPLLLSAVFSGEGFVAECYNPDAMERGACSRI